MQYNDSIEIALPFKSEFISIARLAVSGVASRMGFDLETIEDIKVAVAEVCSRFVNAGSTTAGCYKIAFNIDRDRLVIAFDSDDKDLRCIFAPKSDALGISIIKALMDDIDLCAGGNSIFIMVKSVQDSGR